MGEIYISFNISCVYSEQTARQKILYPQCIISGFLTKFYKFRRFIRARLKVGYCFFLLVMVNITLGEYILITARYSCIPFNS